MPSAELKQVYQIILYDYLMLTLLVGDRRHPNHFNYEKITLRGRWSNFSYF